MSVLELAWAHYREQAALSRGTTRRALEAWAQLDRRDLAGSWASGIGEWLFVAVSSAQLLAASTAEAYASGVLEEQGATAGPVAALEWRAFAGVASDGRDLEPLLFSPVTKAWEALGQGAPVDQAMRAGAFALERIVRTQVRDAGRSALGVATVVRPAASGWVRLLTPPSCSRCVVLAGKWFRWNRGFERHPGCDCEHVPAVRAGTVQAVRTDPRAFFQSLSAGEQDRVFSVRGAQAIRDGADIGQVVNARRGAQGLSVPGRLTAEEQRMLRGGRSRGRLERVDVFGRPVSITREGVTTRGLAGRRLGAREAERSVKTAGQRYRTARTPRLMPEAIYELAGDDRTEAIRLLKRFGYVL